MRWVICQTVPSGSPQLNLVVSYTNDCSLGSDTGRHLDFYFGSRSDWAGQAAGDRRMLFQAKGCSNADLGKICAPYPCHKLVSQYFYASQYFYTPFTS